MKLFPFSVLICVLSASVQYMTLTHKFTESSETGDAMICEKCVLFLSNS